MDFLGDSVVNNLPAIEEMRVQSLGQEDTLEKEMATHSSILAWKILDRGDWQAPVSPWGHKRIGQDLETKQQQRRTLIHYINIFMFKLKINYNYGLSPSQ